MTERPAETTPSPSPSSSQVARPGGKLRALLDALFRRRSGPPEVRFEQAVYGTFAFRDHGYAMLAQSPKCRPEWLADFRAACQRIGERPAGVSERAGLFALRLPSGVWAVVGMTPQGLDDRGRPGALAFHALFLSRRDYRKAGGDPFAFAALLRSDWDASTSILPSAVWAPGGERGSMPPDPRLFSVVAALSRGRRVAIESPEPIDALARQVWQALPPRVRRRASVATWAFANGNVFDLVAVPRLAGVALDRSYEGPAAFGPAVVVEASDAEPPPGVASSPLAGEGWGGGGSGPAEVCNTGSPSELPEPAPGGLLRSPRTLAALGAAVVLASAAVALALRGEGDDDEEPAPRTVTTPPREDHRTTVREPSARVRRSMRLDSGAPDPGAFPAAREDDDPAERRRVAEVLEDLADRCGVSRSEAATADPVALMERLARELRYRGPWLSGADRARIKAGESARASSLALGWDGTVRRFAPDRPLPDDFRSGAFRWQLAVLAWSFHVEDARGAGVSDGPDAPRRSPSEVAQVFAGALARDVPVTPDAPLVDRYPALGPYLAFLGRLPRR